MAIQAALTGHLVLSTLHTNDAPSAVTRLLDIGVPSYLLQSTLLGVMAQRLVRTLCPQCREKCEIDDSAWEMLVAPWKAAKPKDTTYTAKGCLECRMTGYLGRMGIYETLVMTPELRKAVTDETDLDALREKAFKEGMKPLAHQRRPEDRRRPHHHRRSHEGRAAARRRPAAAFTLRA